MNDEIMAWAWRWGITSPAALQELLGIVTPTYSGEAPPVRAGKKKSEDSVKKDVLLSSGRHGHCLLRNNVGVAFNENGVPIRYGLANESHKQNLKFKSSDLIGITRLKIRPSHVGKFLGVFTTIETKKEGWRYAGTPREVAQLRFIEFAIASGAIGGFVTCENDYLELLRGATEC